ncbi:Hypothetical protein R9X50_00752600 [Acrodontium crateriforme]|uniref:LYC1 C-terminal domain-containing protein n=1 Tax=Acrodontium crateriforme TaxID=150365 RepID=A0AAQ3RE72_9PEZI|nr:Hypothetical protein R9X50_00752600 [Acrodontium crateriforme]
MGSTELPHKDSPDVHLVEATEEESIAQQHANSAEWQGQLDLDAYLRRETVLINQDLTRDGGLTTWVLVHQPENGPRKVLCGCESIKKKALLARSGKVEDVVAHGIASVFCEAKHRGKGYASRMMSELGKKLKSWQAGNGSSAFSVLYSDIGKEFYAAHGWQAFPSAHITLTPTASFNAQGLPAARVLADKDIESLCTLDEEITRRRMAQNAKSNRPAVTLIPDHRTLAWHYAREDFFATEKFKKTSSDRGAIVGDWAGTRAWCYWTGVWPTHAEVDPNILYILRIAVEDESFADFEPASEHGIDAIKDSPSVKAIAAVLAKAQAHASEWNMHQIQIWNPTSATVAAVQLLDSNATVEHREKESITSLRWYGEEDAKDVDWVMKEKFAWC